VVDANGGVTRTTYDSMGRRASLTDPLRNRSEFHYDGRGRGYESAEVCREWAELARDPFGMFLDTKGAYTISHTVAHAAGRQAATSAISSEGLSATAVYTGRTFLREFDVSDRTDCDLPPTRGR